MSDNPTVLVAKIVPPGSTTLPAPIHLIAGDTLTVHVAMTGEYVNSQWESTFEANINMVIEFDYMEIKTLGDVKGTLFTEIAHSESS